MDETAFENLQEARINSVTKPYAEKATWNGFKFNEKPSEQIDFFLVQKNNTKFKIQNDYRLL